MKHDGKVHFKRLDDNDVLTDENGQPLKVAAGFVVGEEVSVDISDVDVTDSPLFTPANPAKAALVVALFQGHGVIGQVMLGPGNGYALVSAHIPEIDGKMITLSLMLPAGETYYVNRESGDATLVSIYERALG